MEFETTILLSGYSELNLGDDLFFKIIIKRYPNVFFVFPARKQYKRVWDKEKNVKIINRDNILYKIISYISALFEPCSYYIPPGMILRWLKRQYDIKHIIIIGGSIFPEDSDHGDTLYKSFIKMKRILNNCSLFILGCNFGPFKTSRYKENVAKILELADDVCFRDIESYNLFKDISTIRFGNDTVFHMNIGKSVEKEKIIGISLVDISKFNDISMYYEEYINKIYDIIYYFQSLQYKIILISFCNHLGDDTIVDSIYRGVRDKNSIGKYYYNGNAQEALQLISSFEYMIASRFHAVILGLIYKIKVYPIAYSNKTKDMLLSYKLWNDNYSIEKFVGNSITDINEHFIDNFSVDISNNVQFDKIDTLFTNMK